MASGGPSKFDLPEKSAEVRSDLGARPGGESLFEESPDAFYIVGVGASAGGLEALEQLFEEMPADIGMAFVVVQHLSPDFKSHMKELLARKTALDVTTVTDQMPVVPNKIFLIPPKKEMVISGGRLLLSDKDPCALNLPIDLFFTSLAEDAGPRAIGIVLSGTGSDGSQGVQNIHAAGGLVICQTVESAKFDGMPINAQKTGVVDLAIAPSEVATTLSRYALESLPPAQFAQQSPIAADDSAMGEILRLLHQEYGFDFSLYKEQTTLRRIMRRMNLQDAGNLEEYARWLQKNSAERDELCKDLLIGVTRFFRDREAFEQLEKLVIPGILSRVPPGQTIRVWIAGCATGRRGLFGWHVAGRGIAAQPKTGSFQDFCHRCTSSVAEVCRFGKPTPKLALEEVTPARREHYFRNEARFFPNHPRIKGKNRVCAAQRDQRCAVHALGSGDVPQLAYLSPTSGTAAGPFVVPFWSQDRGNSVSWSQRVARVDFRRV